MDTPIERIVIGFDTTPLAARALEAALRFAEGRGATELHVAHVERPPTTIPPLFGEPPTLIPTPTLDPSVRDHVTAVAAQLLERYPLRRFVLLTHELLGDVVHELVELAHEVDATLIVIGTHGHTGLARLFSGTAEMIVRRAPCPVLVVRAVRRDEPAIEPLCPECRLARDETGDPLAWCGRHSEHHLHGRPIPSRRDAFRNE